jgi:hypothetical protein
MNYALTNVEHCELNEPNKTTILNSCLRHNKIRFMVSGWYEMALSR